MCSTPIAAADSAATSISLKPSRSKPVVKVSSFGLCRLASAAMAVESMPPDRNDADRDVGAHVLLDRVLERLGDLAVQLVRVRRRAGSRSRGGSSGAGAAARPGLHGEVGAGLDPADARVCIDAGSGTYCSVR